MISSITGIVVLVGNGAVGGTTGVVGGVAGVTGCCNKKYMMTRIPIKMYHVGSTSLLETTN